MDGNGPRPSRQRAYGRKRRNPLSTKKRWSPGPPETPDRTGGVKSGMEAAVPGLATQFVGGMDDEHEKDRDASQAIQRGDRPGRRPPPTARESGGQDISTISDESPDYVRYRSA